MPSLSRRQFLGTTSAAIIGASSFGYASAQVKRPTLPLPKLMDGDNGTPIDMKISKGEWSFKPGIVTPTYGFNTGYLGPTLRTRKESTLSLRYHNQLDEGVSVHGHGLHVPGNVDGGPQLKMPPGERWSPDIAIKQPAATCWYHSHTHGRTGYQTYHGLAGMIIIDDEESDGLPLPKSYGIDDFPIILQDRTIGADGKLVYSLMEAGEDGWLGEDLMINGAMSPQMRVPAGKVRLRLLNGANARFFIFGFSDERVFHQIATDGGLLTKPKAMTRMEIAPGERVEIIVDLADGRDVEFITWYEDLFESAEESLSFMVMDLFGKAKLPVPQSRLLMRVDPSLPAVDARLPERLVSIATPVLDDVMRTRDFMLTMDHGAGLGRHVGISEAHAAMDMGINGFPMNMRVINEQVPLGQWERWRFRSDQGAHPFHVHGCSFLIETVEGKTVPLAENGWKDTVMMDDDVWTNVIVRFDHKATEDHPYMYHCHILEHEDRGMMGQFTVT